MVTKDTLGPLEMKVLGLIQPEERISVGDLQKRLQGEREELAYTTVMTVLSRLFEKGYLGRVKSGRAFVYSRNKKSHHQAETMFTRIQRTLFRHEKLKPILALLDAPGSLSKEELRELRKRVDEKLKHTED